MSADFRLKEDLPELTDRIVASYHDLGVGHHLGHCPLPNTAEVCAIARDLKGVLFPGYRTRQNLHMGNIGFHVGALVDSLHDRLTEQTARALRHDFMRRAKAADPDSEPCTKEVDFEADGQRVTLAFLNQIPALRELLVEDVKAAYEGDPAAASYDEVIFCYPGLSAVTAHRIAHALHSLGVPLIPRMIAEWSHAETGIDIHPGARIGPGFFIDHGTGVVIGATCRIAENVKIYQGVTLGAKSFPRDGEGRLVRNAKRHPTVERDVVVYSNATVLGGDVTLGCGAVIGAGATITESVAPGTKVTAEKPSLRFRTAG
ncbi:serine O-acetyltransferase [Alienimonas sp. DA493]|uniref:serine O-acetyltransferase n=1 Tax=Alienimonas sp. DA493 TaxID=3373605 RepID=UPI003753EFE9